MSERGQPEGERSWTFRDAGQLPFALRVFNALGRLRPSAARLDPVAIVAKAQESTGLEDFGGEEWREGLEKVCEAALAMGREVSKAVP